MRGLWVLRGFTCRWTAGIQHTRYDRRDSPKDALDSEVVGGFESAGAYATHRRLSLAASLAHDTVGPNYLTGRRLDPHQLHMPMVVAHSFTLLVRAPQSSQATRCAHSHSSVRHSCQPQRPKFWSVQSPVAATSWPYTCILRLCAARKCHAGVGDSSRKLCSTGWRRFVAVGNARRHRAARAADRRGRGASCDLCVDARGVSRTHAEFSLGGVAAGSPHCAARVDGCLAGVAEWNWSGSSQRVVGDEGRHPHPGSNRPTAQTEHGLNDPSQVRLTSLLVED